MCDADLGAWLAESCEIAEILADLDRSDAKPVRAIFFDKSPRVNWALGWHQDRTICVRKAAFVLGYGPYSKKDGLVHVEPPYSVLARMLTLRIHLDPVDENNGVLRVAAGTHTLGRIPTDAVSEAVSCSKVIQCDASIGNIWAYSTPILHSSDRSRSNSPRRVLQIDYSEDDLPHPLEWVGIGAKS